jgi:hypothetical protein
MMVIVGAVESCRQLNSSEDKFPFPPTSVKASAATLIVQSPSAFGVNVAVYVAPDPENTESSPLVTVTSVASKSIVDSDDVNVNESVPSDETSPSETSDAVMAIVGGVMSM